MPQPVSLPRRLVQLDEVAGRVLQKRLAVASHGNRIAHLHAPAPELVDGGVEVVDEQREVLAAGRGRRRVDQVDLLDAGVEPDTVDAEVRRPVPALGQPQDVDIEGDCGIDVVDVDGDMVDGERLHPTSLAPSNDPCPAHHPASSPTAVDHGEMPAPHDVARCRCASRCLPELDVAAGWRGARRPRLLVRLRLHDWLPVAHGLDDLG